MIQKTLPILLVLLVLASCQSGQSSSGSGKVPGLITKGNGLSCDDIYITIDGHKVGRNSFVYGETVEVEFNNIDGFNLLNDAAFAGMKITITDKKGKIVLSNNDLFEDKTAGVKEKPLKLIAFFTTASPISSNQSYTAKIHIWDKKGKGTFDATLPFTVKANPSLHHQTSGVSFDEVYLFDQDNQLVFSGDSILPERKIFLFYEGLKGFKSEDGMSHIGVSMYAKDAAGRMFIEEADLSGDTPIKSDVLAAQLAPNFIFNNVGGGNLKNPVKLEVVIWDKLGTAKIKTTIDLQVRTD
jgi:hypothetical protein